MTGSKAAPLGAVLLLTVGLAASCTAADDDGPLSGLPKGSGVPAFNVYAVTGPQKDSKLCYV
ncbi:MAG: hypothetical protein ACLF0G_04805 [Candidatus Brocadiia bacterium]